jgi:hypothetical protein
MRRFVVFLLLLMPALAWSAILPPDIGTWQKGKITPAPAPDPKVWDEYGLQDSETAEYTGGGPAFTITAYRFSDATGANAALDAIRPAAAKPGTLMGISLETPKDEYVAAGNYLFIFKGYRIKPEELSHVVATVSHYAHSPLPTLPKYFPDGFDPNSQRYILGPEGLAKYVPSIPPATAAFSFSSEGQLVKYGPTTLLIFSYPVMEMARKQYPEFQKVPGAIVKRAGPLVALTLGAPDANVAERLLAQVKYEAEITIHPHVPTLRDNPANLFWNVFLLCVAIAGFCLMSGLLFGGLRILLRRTGDSGEGDEMISLHLSGRP